MPGPDTEFFAARAEAGQVTGMAVKEALEEGTEEVGEEAANGAKSALTAVDDEVAQEGIAEGQEVVRGSCLGGGCFTADTWVVLALNLGLRADQIVRLCGPWTRRLYPECLRRISFVDLENNVHFVFLTNNFRLAASTITRLYHCRWEVELFFKWVKQYLRIKAFFGTSSNAVKTQVWIAMSVCLLASIVKKYLHYSNSMGEILQILSLTLFEKESLLQLLSHAKMTIQGADDANSLPLLEI